MNTIIPADALKMAGVKTTREFKQKKRKEIGELVRALNKLQHMGAFTPGISSHDDLGLELALEFAEGIQYACSLKRWGR